mmetsp:Transcript_13335/g.42320  ORF Transcript_13335/g.42320 Transcript_13335/m.42320 type:complete len:258 (-) Transcript_13335:491-1264(-)
MLREEARDLLRKVLSEALDELARHAAARVRVASLDVAADVLEIVHLELLLVLLAHPQVGNDDELADVLECVLVRKELVMNRLGDGGQEAYGVRGQLVLARGRAHLEKQPPHVLHEGAEVARELLLALLHVHVDVLADGRFDLVGEGGLFLVVLIEEGVLVAEDVMKLPHPLAHGVLEHLREAGGVEGEEYPADETLALEQLLENLCVGRGLLDGHVGGLEELRHRLDEHVQHIFELQVQLLGLELVTVALEDRVRGH